MLLWSWPRRPNGLVPSSFEPVRSLPFASLASCARPWFLLLVLLLLVLLVLLLLLLVVPSNASLRRRRGGFGFRLRAWHDGIAVALGGERTTQRGRQRWVGRRSARGVHVRP